MRRKFENLSIEKKRAIHPKKIEILKEKLIKLGMLKNFGDKEIVGKRGALEMMKKLYRESLDFEKIFS